jgi:3-phenylpropionate/trans-cinnamate dioxygenase ferredoxin reductase subunit
MKPAFVVIGANVAGATVADELRDLGFDGGIGLVGAEPHLPYQRPPLSKGVLSGADAPEATVFRDEAHYAERDIDLHLGARVARLLPAERAVELEDGSRLRADKVVLCTGGRARRLDVPGAELDGVATLRTLDDAVDLGDRLARASSVVVIGAGFIGAEVAAVARGLGRQVTMIEVAEVPLARVLGPLGAVYAEIHRDQGVDVRLGTAVTAVLGNEHVEGVRTSTGDVVEADLVVVGVGMEPAVELAAGAGIATGNGVLVDEWCRTSIPAVLAAGDVANRPSALLGERCRLEQFQHAQQQAAAAARTMLGGGDPFDDVPWFWSDQYDVNLQMAGHPRWTDELVWRGDPASRSFAVFYRRDGVLTGAVGLNRPKEVRGAMPLIGRRARVEPAVLQDESVDLRKVAKALAAAVAT